MREIGAVHGLDAVRQISGVDQIIPGLQVGDEFSWWERPFVLVATVLGAAPDHEPAHRVRDGYDMIVVSGSQQQGTESEW
ncbi:hypothetical protein ACFPJ4_00990 [Lysinimonas soli]|uniref:Uncharacterized protein n=1 Tax=Lysinimonas soli TaxID=1074233 RepID=A0ABW0NLJ1_9MICO